jgi:peroxiredoxin
MIRFVFLIYFILCFSFHIFSQDQSQVRIIEETSRPAAQIANIYPFDIDLLQVDGSKLKSSQVFHKNKKATVLLFWMTTCGPCRMELNAISQKFNQWKKQMDFDLFAISTDFSDRVEQFNTRVNDSKWPFPAVMDINREFRYVMEGGLNGLPQVFVLDKKGAVIYHTRKYRPGDEDLLFQKLLSLK